MAVGGQKRPTGKSTDARLKFRHTTRKSCRNSLQGITQGKSKHMVINTNMAAITSASNLDKSTNELNNALAQLSSGSKITSPMDDPAGLAESIALNAQIGQTQAANSN